MALPLPMVWGDHDCLVVVFRNLLENAVKYSTADCRVSVACLDGGQPGGGDGQRHRTGHPARGSTVCVRVLLYRGKNAVQTPGSGLGLSDRCSPVHLNHGTLHADSAAGKGTRITVRLPRAKV